MNERPKAANRKSWWYYPTAMPPSILISAIWIVFMVLVAVLADVIAPYDYKHMDLLDRLRPPIWMENGIWSHMLGTDDLGRDMLSRIIFSIRISLFVALLGTFIGAVLGTTLGFVAAHFRGRVDDLIMILIDFQAALHYL